MGNGDLNWIANYIWGIADDVLRDLYVRGKYRDVILPMTVLRRLDSVLEDGKQSVLDMKTMLDEAGVVEQDSALRQAAGKPSITPRVLPCATCAPAPAASNSRPTFELGSTDSHPTCRTFWTASNSVTRSRTFPRLTPSAPDREAHFARYQPEPRAGEEYRRKRAPSRP